MIFAVFQVARPGFEPRPTEPKSVVLPLYYQAIKIFDWGAKIGSPPVCTKILFDAHFTQSGIIFSDL